MKNPDGWKTTHYQGEPSQGWGKMQQGRCKSAGHTDPGQECSRAHQKSQGAALQVGIVPLFLLGFRCGAGIIPLPSQAVREPWAAMPAPLQTLLAANTELKGVRTRRSKHNDLCNFR